MEQQLKERELSKLRTSLFNATTGMSLPSSASPQKRQQKSPSAGQRQHLSSHGDKYFRADSKFRAIDVLRLLDKDGDGCISRSELQALYARGSIDASSYQAVQQAFLAADKDGNGVLDAREFKRFLLDASPNRRRAISPPQPQQSPPQPPQPPQQPQELPLPLPPPLPPQQPQAWLSLEEEAALAEECTAAAERKAEAHTQKLAALASQSEAERGRAVAVSTPFAEAPSSLSALGCGPLRSAELTQPRQLLEQPYLSLIHI